MNEHYQDTEHVHDQFIMGNRKDAVRMTLKQGAQFQFRMGVLMMRCADNPDSEITHDDVRIFGKLLRILGDEPQPPKDETDDRRNDTGSN